MDLDQRHPLYEAYINRWKAYLASYLGGEDYRAPSLAMLRKYINEDSAPGNQYSQRLNHTALDNLTKLAIDTYRSFLFRNTPLRTFGGMKDNELVNRFLDDIDFNGQDLDDFMKNANDLASVYGHVWIMVTKGFEEGVVTLQQEIEADIRPYARVFTPENVVNWKYERKNNGSEYLSELMTMEYVNEEQTRYVIWTPQDITTLLVTEQGETLPPLVEMTELQGNEIGRIPFVLLKANHSQYREIGQSDIADVVTIQKAIFNLLSEAEQGVRISNHPTLVKTFDTDAMAGAGAVVDMDPNMDPALKPYLLEPNGTNIESIVNMIDVHVDAFLRATHLGAIMSGRGLTPKSGIALQTEFQQLNTRLGDKAAKLEQAEQNIWELFWAYTGLPTPIDFEVVYEKSFDLRDAHADFTLYAQALALDIPSESYKRALMKQIAEVVIEDGDSLDDIMAEIESMDVSNYTIDTPNTSDGI